MKNKLYIDKGIKEKIERSREIENKKSPFIFDESPGTYIEGSIVDKNKISKQDISANSSSPKLKS